MFKYKTVASDLHDLLKVNGHWKHSRKYFILITYFRDILTDFLSFLALLDIVCNKHIWFGKKTSFDKVFNFNHKFSKQLQIRGSHSASKQFWPSKTLSMFFN